ncbi:MAG TPA: hypothetical protein VGP57_24565 [Actinoplanes sp.]|jgi:hypothetical protein|nr:hypothetical protein [Actinoplanes sp.]
MKFLLITLITHLDPAKPTRQRFREVVDNATTFPAVPLGGVLL